MISKKLKVNVEDIQNIFIYGNHSSTMVPDFSMALSEGKELEKCKDMTKDYLLEASKSVTQRGAAVMNLRKLSSALSAATGIKDHLRDLYHGTNGK